MTERVVFYYDLNSPYAWLAAERVDSVLPEPPVWQPIAYAFVIKHTGRTPWPLGPERTKHVAEIERRAAERGLPPLRWPRGHPVETYSLEMLRATLVATEAGCGKEFSLAAFRRQFTEGRPMSKPGAVGEVAGECGLDRDAVVDGSRSGRVKAALKAATEAAISRGVVGIPTVRVGSQLFWGDDKLEEAAAALAGSARTSP